MRARYIAMFVAGAVLVGLGSFYLGEHQRDSSDRDARGAAETERADADVTSVQPPRTTGPMHPPTGGQSPQRAGGSTSTPRYTHFQVGNSNVKAMLSDGALMWIGTGGGVIRYNTVTNEHHLFDVRSGLLSNGVFHLSKFGGKLFVGTYGGGLSVFKADSETWDNYNIQHGLADAFVYDVCQTKSGDLWIATWSGANRVKNGNLDVREEWETYTVKNTRGGVPNDWVYALREGLDGDVWLATEGGVALYRQGVWTHWTHADGVGAPYEQVRDQIEFKRDPAKESSHHARQKAEQGLQDVDIAYNPNYIVALEVDAQGTVWAGTWGGGLSRFDGKNWSTLTTDDGLPSNHVFLLHIDAQGVLWIGTSKGLARKEAERFTVFTMSDGLFANSVFSIARSDRGDLWVGGYGGVVQFQGLPGTR